MDGMRCHHNPPESKMVRFCDSMVHLKSDDGNANWRGMVRRDATKSTDGKTFKVRHGMLAGLAS